MKCRKCKAEIPNESKFCLACGARQQDAPRRPKSRGNGQGTVYQLPNKTWIASVTTGYSLKPDGKLHRATRSKSGFKTKREALEYMPRLISPQAKATPERPKPPTLEDIYNAWRPTHKAGKSTMDGYKYAFAYFKSLWAVPLEDIPIEALQQCLSDCDKGRRTRENMKALAGLLYKFAIPRGLATINMGQFLDVGGGERGEKEALPEEAVEKLAQAVGKVPGADLVLAHCYLGFRPGEFLALTASNYNAEQRAFVGGAKTDAGKNRTVTVSPKIQAVVDDLIARHPSGPLISGEDGKPLTLKRYSAIMYDALEAVGVDNPIIKVAGVERHRYTPHSCRHTFATMMKRVAGADKDKLELIGHTSTEMLRHYQDVNFDDLRRITDAL